MPAVGALGITLLIAVAQLSCGGSSMPAEMQPPPPAPVPPVNQITLTQLSMDSFTNPGSQHATEVEPSLYANGSTLVTAFQVGRFFGGGASGIGFAISTDSGATWSNGLLPGITTFDGGSYSAVSDPAVVYDAAHAAWIITSLAIGNTIQVIVSRSSDTKNWDGPIVVSATPNADKNWIACDNTSSSPYFGHCYLEWDDPNSNGLIWMSTSTDGGLTWSAAINTIGAATGVGGQPVIQPSGVVIVPILNGDGTQMIAFASSDGGTSWSAPVSIATITDHLVAGNLRTTTLPAAAADSAGTVYVMWQDCRFRTNCASNDIVLSTSPDGATWSAPVRIPIDAAASTFDHFIMGLAADPATGGASAHLALTYYFYTNANCTAATCALNVGFVSSQDGGNSWTAPLTLAGPMSLAWLPSTSSGVMVGDYVATAYTGGKAYAVFAVAQANTGVQFNEAIYTTPSALAAARLVRVHVSQEQIITTHADHAQKRFEDVDEDLYPERRDKDNPERKK